jgi:hypothetical protein
MFVQSPNTSLFPEIDVAAKSATDVNHGETLYLEDTPRTLSQLLWPLSNAFSIEIRRRLRSKRFYVRFSDNEFQDGGAKTVVIKLQDNGMLLNNKGFEYEKSVQAESAAYQSDAMSEELRTVPYPSTQNGVHESQRYF